VCLSWMVWMDEVVDGWMIEGEGGRSREVARGLTEERAVGGRWKGLGR